MAHTMTLHEAEALARRQVVSLWPELAAVKPQIAPWRQHLPAAETPRAAVADQAAAADFVFTFTGQMHTADGYTLPYVARVVVNTERGVVKLSASR